MLEIIGAAVMIAFGFLAIYFSAEEGINDSRMMMILIIGMILIVGGGWIILTRISIAMLLAKIAGVIFAFLGFFLIWGFPDVGDYQNDSMSKAGVFLGLIFFIIGIYLLFFFV
jgi:hypothetical protein